MIDLANQLKALGWAILGVVFWGFVLCVLAVVIASVV
jgi:hypothetical protein